MLITNPVAQLR